MVSYFFRIQQLWEYDNKSDLMMIYANIILGTGPGVVDWYQNMGRFVLVPRFQDFIDELLDE